MYIMKSTYRNHKSCIFNGLGEDELQARYMGVSERLEAVRDYFGWDQVEMSAVMRVSKGAVNRWHNGTARPSWDALHLLKSKHRVNDEWVMTGKGEMLIPIESSV